MNPITVGKIIADKRKELNMTQRELAELLYVTDKAVSKWERGINYPDLNIIESLSKVLHVNVTELLGLEIESQNATDTLLKAATTISNEKKMEYKKKVKNDLIGFVVLGFIILVAVLVIELTTAADIQGDNIDFFRDILWGYIRFSGMLIPGWAIRSLVWFRRI